ncbi:MAG: hypothetical protein SPL59_05045 [Catonella sp.]|jgi:hypothetical protein|nr:hypothetical protein [Catonella sp.]
MKTSLKRTLAAVMIATSSLAAIPTVTLSKPVEVNAATFDYTDITGSIKPLKDISNVDAIESVYSSEVTLEPEHDTELYVKFNLSKDSWVYLTGNSSNYKEVPFISLFKSTIKMYSNADQSREVASMEWNPEDDTAESAAWSGFLKKGTYYVALNVLNELSGDTISANENIFISYIPLSEALKATVKKTSGKKVVKVSISNHFGQYLQYVQYQKGNISITRTGDKNYWKQGHSLGLDKYDAKAAHILTEANGKYSFKAKKNGYYTFWLQTTSGSQWSFPVKVSGLK